MAENKDRDQFNRKKDEDDHPDHRINRNADEDSLKNKEETENKNSNDDVTGGGVTSQGESSSASDDVSSNQRKRRLNPLEQNVLGHIQNVDGETVPVFYSQSVTGSPIPPSIDSYVNSGLDANFRSSGRVTGVNVGPIAQKGRFTIFDMAPFHDGSDNENNQEDDTEHDRDQQGGSSSKDAKKAKK